MDDSKVLALAEKLDPLIGILTSYRAKLRTAEFSEAVIDQMCVQLHGVILTQGLMSQGAKK